MLVNSGLHTDGNEKQALLLIPSGVLRDTRNVVNPNTRQVLQDPTNVPRVYPTWISHWRCSRIILH